jgi:hypothetical protein
MVAIASRPQLPSTSKASGAGPVLGFLRVAGSLHARVDEALAAAGLSYREYRVLESLEGPASAEAGGSVRTATAEHATLAALRVRGLVALSRRAQGNRRATLTRLGSRSLQVARARVRPVAREFAAAVGDTEASALAWLLERRRRD